MYSTFHYVIHPQVVLVGHSFGALVSMYANQMQPNSIKGLILLDPTPAFSEKLQRAANIVLQGICAVTTKKTTKFVEDTNVGKLIQTVTNEFPKDAPVGDDQTVNMADEVKTVSLKVACGTVKKINTYVSADAINTLSSLLSVEKSAIIFGQNQRAYGTIEYSRRQPESQQVIKASYNNGEHFIHFPRTWNGNQGETGERDRCVGIVANFLKEKIDA